MATHPVTDPVPVRPSLGRPATVTVTVLVDHMWTRNDRHGVMVHSVFNALKSWNKQEFLPACLQSFRSKDAY